MADRAATIRLAAAGGERVRSVLNGLTRQVQSLSAVQRRGASESTRAAVDGARQRERAEQRTARVVTQVSELEIRDARRRAREVVRLSEETGRTRVRVAQRTAREIAREEEDLARRRGRQAAGGGGGRVGPAMLAAGGVLAGGAQALYGRAAATAGIGSLDQRIQAAGEFGMGVMRFAANAGIDSTARDRLQSQIVSTSDRTGLRSGQLLAGLESAQARFGPEIAMDLAGSLDQLANASVATGSSVEDLIGLLGTVQTAYRLNGEELQDFLNSTVQATREGSIDARDFAGSFASTLALYASSTNRRGIAGAREAVGLAEVIGSGQFGAAESATRMEALVRELSDPRVQDRFREAGVNIANSAGNLLPMEQIAANVQGSRQLATSRGISSLRLDSRAESALMVLREQGVEGFRKFANADAAEGARFVQSTSSEMLSSEYAQLTRIGTRRENDTIRDADRIIATYRETVDSVSGLQSQFPILTEVMGTLTTAIQTLIPALVTASVFKGGGSAAAAALGFGGAGAAGAAGGGGLLAGLAGSSAAMVGLPVVGAAALVGSELYRNARDSEANAALRTEAQRVTNEALSAGRFDTARDAFAVELEASGEFDQARLARRGASAAPAFVPEFMGGGTSQPVRLDPESVLALANAIQPNLPEGTAGEGSATRGRRSSASPAERR
jgi:hypothetical protein